MVDLSHRLAVDTSKFSLGCFTALRGTLYNVYMHSWCNASWECDSDLQLLYKVVLMPLIAYKFIG